MYEIVYGMMLLYYVVKLAVFVAKHFNRTKKKIKERNSQVGKTLHTYSQELEIIVEHKSEEAGCGCKTKTDRTLLRFSKAHSSVQSEFETEG